MNFSIRILSVFTALIIIFQPVLPYIEYFAFQKYIAKNLCINQNKPSCCHGKCFLKKMLKESNSSSEQKAPVKSQQKAFDTSLPTTTYGIKKSMGYVMLYSHYLETYKFDFPVPFFHPPQNSIS
jgi:hypothetical protein